MTRPNRGSRWYHFNLKTTNVIPTPGRNLGMGGTAPPQIPRRFASRNDSFLHVTDYHNHLEVVLVRQINDMLV